MLEVRAGLLLVLLAYAAVFGRAVSFDLVWDDLETIARNPQFDAALGDGLLATQHDHHDPSLLLAFDVPYESYRPLTFASLRLDRALFGDSTVALHAHSLALGALSVVLAFAVTTHLLPSRRAALLATGLFALHPLQAEAVCYVSARADLLAAALALASALGFLRALESAGQPRRVAGLAALAALAWLGSLAAKEAYLGLPLALAVLAVAMGRLRAAGAPLGALGAALVLYAAARLAILPPDIAGVETGVALAALWKLPGLALAYVGPFLLPVGLSIERAPDVAALAPFGWLALAGVATAFAGSAWRSRAPTALACAGPLWLVALLGPASLAVETTGVAADRYVYLPLLGLAISAAGLGSLLPARRPFAPVFPAAAAAWLAALALASFFQAGLWRDSETLYRRALRAAPARSMSHYRVGVLYAEREEWQRAAPFFEAAIERDPGNLRALGNLSLAYLHTDRLERAERTVRRDLELSGDRNFRAWTNLATLFFKRSDLERTCTALERALAIRPGYDVAARNHRLFCAEGGSAKAAPATGR